MQAKQWARSQGSTTRGPAHGAHSACVEFPLPGVFYDRGPNHDAKPGEALEHTSWKTREMVSLSWLSFLCTITPHRQTQGQEGLNRGWQQHGCRRRAAGP